MSEPTRKSHKVELDLDPARRRVIRALADLRARLKAIESATLFSNILTSAEEEQRLKSLQEEFKELTNAFRDWKRFKIQQSPRNRIPPVRKLLPQTASSPQVAHQEGGNPNTGT